MMGITQKKDGGQGLWVDGGLNCAIYGIQMLGLIAI
jgi:hypothetical protein